jgi:hypothetical protein
VNDASDDTRDPLDVLTEQFLGRRRAGEHLDVEQFAQAHPGYAAELRELLPTLLALEQLKREKESSGGSGRARFVLPAFERLGDFRIVREIGRGGMGAVFLAERADGAFDRLRPARRRIATAGPAGTAVLPRSMAGDCGARRACRLPGQPARSPRLATAAIVIRPGRTEATGVAEASAGQLYFAHARPRSGPGPDALPAVRGHGAGGP